jgi:hypothetical protein
MEWSPLAPHNSVLEQVARFASEKTAVETLIFGRPASGEENRDYDFREDDPTWSLEAAFAWLAGAAPSSVREIQIEDQYAGAGVAVGDLQLLFETLPRLEIVKAGDRVVGAR